MIVVALALFSLEFPDNRLLAELCGEFDRNLTTIETAQSIQIVRRGNQLFLVGDGDARVRAESILQSLYTRLEQGRHVLAADVTALRIRMSEPLCWAMLLQQGRFLGAGCMRA